MSMRDVKICLLGDGRVGKSSIVHRFVAGTFDSKIMSTVGASFMTKTIFVDDMTFRFQIWDTAGQEKYRALAPMYYRGAAAAIIVYDVTKQATFSAMKGWIHEIQRFGPSEIVLAIAGNKCDLEDLREVKTEDAEEFADEMSAFFCETSALTAENISEMFHAIAQLLPQEGMEVNKGTISLRKSNNKKKANCCSGSSADSNRTSLPQVNHRNKAVPRYGGYRPASLP